MHTLAVLRQLEGILNALAPEDGMKKSQENADSLNGLLVQRLGRYSRQVGEHLRVNLNADRSARALLFFAALYHDVSKPHTQTVEESGRIRFLGHDEQGAKVAVKRGAALRLSNDELARLQIIIRNHMRIHFHTSRKINEGKEPSPKAIYRFLRNNGA